MRFIAVLALLIFPLADVAAQYPARPSLPRPAACAAFRTADSSLPAEHVPYPKVRQPWPVDVSIATIVKDPLVARHSSDRFRPPSVEQVRKELKRYYVVPRTVWKDEYSHVAGGDEGGWLVSHGRCFMSTLRPGGLGWIVYPDGTAVYLAADLHRPS